MAAKRLQLDMDRHFKKIDEGIAIFDEIWELAHDRLKEDKRERYEADLKKEIKKLQRLREQLKVWLGDKSIRVKTTLYEYRKKIEMRMGQFKECESDAKVRPFSNVGLTKESRDVDPCQEALDRSVAWIDGAILALHDQCNNIEAGIEGLNVVRKKKKRAEGNTRVTELREKIERHQFHIGMLEKTLRALRNGKIKSDEVDDLQGGVEYYVDSNESPDFVEDEELYNALELDSGMATTPQKEEDNTADQDDDETADAACTGVADKNPQTVNKPQAVKTSTTVHTSASPKTLLKPGASEGPRALTPSRSPTQGKKVEEVNSQKGTGKNKLMATNSSEFPRLPQNTEPRQGETQDTKQKKAGVGVVKKLERAQPLFSTVVKERPVGGRVKDDIDDDLGSPADEKLNKLIPVVCPSRHLQKAYSASPQTPQPMDRNMQLRKSMRFPARRIRFDDEKDGQKDERDSVHTAVHDGVSQWRRLSVSGAGSGKTVQDSCGVKSSMKPGYVESSPKKIAPTKEMESPTAASRQPETSPIARKMRNDQNGWWSAFSRRQLVALFELEQALKNFPEDDLMHTFSNDAVTGGSRCPFQISSNPCVPNKCDVSVFTTLDVEVLFFIFYYRRGSDHYKPATEELRKRGWKYHRVLSTWIRRVTEPTNVTQDYEIGTFVYFDYTGDLGDADGWCQRIKADFKLEYRAVVEDIP